MSITYVTTDSIGTGVRIKRSFNNEDIVINSGVLVFSQDSTAIYCYASEEDVTVEGQVDAAIYGIVLGNDMANDTFNSVLIAEGGEVSASVDAIRFKSASGYLINRGDIYGHGDGVSGGSDGVVVGGIGAGSSVIENYGLIHGNDQGIEVNDGTTETVMLKNFGTISGDNGAYVGDTNIDHVINQGTIHGNIYLKGGNDIYDGRGGSILAGSTQGGEGNDTFLPGGGAEVISGNNGYDTLDFRDSDGLRVSLSDASGTGRAAGDHYATIEGVLGSSTGADNLIGNSSANTFAGFGGQDTLNSSSGDDTLIGGQDADMLTGGSGNDCFEFAIPEEGGDVITDFSSKLGNDDYFWISVSGFSGDMVPGSALEPSAFQTRTDNFAQDDNDRFIFCTTDKTLWFDSNGSGSGGLTLVADLQSTAIVTSADILLV